jgi:hypothetical protein
LGSACYSDAETYFLPRILTERSSRHPAALHRIASIASSPVKHTHHVSLFPGRSVSAIEEQTKAVAGKSAVLADDCAGAVFMTSRSVQTQLAYLDRKRLPLISETFPYKISAGNNHAKAPHKRTRQPLSALYPNLRQASRERAVCPLTKRIL